MKSIDTFGNVKITFNTTVELRFGRLLDRKLGQIIAQNFTQIGQEAFTFSIETNPETLAEEGLNMTNH